MKRFKIHIYPPYLGGKGGPGNTYSKLLWESFEGDGNFNVVNRRLLRKPLWDLPINLDADVFLLSWVEGFANSLSGKVKLLYLFLFICTTKACGKKTVWILHNKHPHKKQTGSSDLAMRWLAKLASHVITHASEGVDFFESRLGGKQGKCVYIPHPVYTVKLYEPREVKWDYIIWGEVSRRKGIAEFLRFANGSLYFADKRVLVCGRCKDKEYAKEIDAQCGENIVFENDFIPADKLHDYILASKCILFTYHSDSVLSSGALVYSLNFCKPILAPSVGAFKDMEGIVTCYDSFDDIPELELHFSLDSCKEYIATNTWDCFPQKLYACLVG